MINVHEAILSRRSVRAFEKKPISLDIIENILKIASRAPSGTNIQPWNVDILTGLALKKFTAEIKNEFLENRNNHSLERLHYMKKFKEPYLKRRRKVGWDLYSLLGIKKGDYKKTSDFHSKNYEFFGAPVGMIFSIEKDLGWMSWLDYGMFIQNICIASRGYGLHSCPQAAWGLFHKKIAEILKIKKNHVVHCGLALGYENIKENINNLRTERESPSEFVTFHK